MEKLKMNRETYTVAEVAEKFHVTERTVRKWALSGKLNRIKLTGTKRVLFLKKEIDALFEQENE